jgi:acyl carrier protein
LKSDEISPDILSLLRRQAAVNPDRAAIVGRLSKQIKFADLATKVELMASNLLACAEPSDTSQRLRTAIVLPNGPDMSLTLLAASISGAAVPLNPAYTEAEFSEYLLQCQASCLVAIRGFAPACERAAERHNLPIVSFEDIAAHSSGLTSKSMAVPAPSDIALILLTSGSTGRPKLVPLTQQNVCTSARDVSQSLGLGPSDRCLSMWELFHIGGLVDMLLAPLHSGGSIIATAGFSATEFFSYSEEFSPTWFQGVPTAFSELVRYAEINSILRVLPRYRFTRSVAAPLQKELAERVADLFGAPVVTTFGMTEAGPLITSTRLPPNESPPSSLGQPCGPEVAVVGDDWIHLAPGVDGEIVIRGPNVFSGYENEPQTNASAFHKGWFRTGDIGHLDKHGNLFLTGRAKEQINRGGEKINPREIDDVLVTHPDIVAAASFPLAHPTLGEDVAAAVVPKPGQVLSERAIREFLGQKLATFKIPRRIISVSALPTNSVGKVDRLELSRMGVRDTTVALVGSETEKKIASIWADEIGLKTVDPAADFVRLGGDSLAAVRMFMSVEKEFQIKLPSADIRTVSTVRDVAELVLNCQEQQEHEPSRGPLEPDIMTGREMRTYMALGGVPTADPGSLFKVTHPDGHQAPLIWIFNDPEREMAAMAANMSDQRPIYGGFSGQGLVDNNSETFELLVDLYADEITMRFKSDELNIGGNCHGGQLAFRVAQRLMERGQNIRKLMLLEFSDTKLRTLDTSMMLVFGRQSKLCAYEPIGWGQNGWAGGFKRPPSVGWVDGFHGGLFRSETAHPICRAIESFCQDRLPGIWTLETKKGRNTMRLHRHKVIFLVYRRLYKLKAQLYDMFEKRRV